MTVRARRVYEAPDTADGRRVLVDRLWPRGLAKAAAHIDEWLKAIAPSDELRRWYGHDPPSSRSSTAATATSCAILSAPRRSRTCASWPPRDRSRC